MRYLLVTHIPFSRRPDGAVLLDQLWLEDLKGLANSIGPVRIAAPLVQEASLRAWGIGLAECPLKGLLQFLPLPVRRGRFDVLHGPALRRALRAAVDEADLVHTSNLFGNDTALYAAHDRAVRLGKKTLFVMAEDFRDMLGWEWVRTAPSPLQRFRRRRTLERLDRAVRRRVRSASLVLLHTPAAVRRYRLDANNAFAIRQPVHEADDVLSDAALQERNAALVAGAPLRIVTASRLQLHKGLDFLLRAVALLRDRGVSVSVTILGSGDQETALRTLTQRLRIGDRVHFAGAMPPGAKMRSAVAEHHLFAMPHLTTDFGRSFFDAMSAACPVIAFRSEASEDTLRAGNDGVLVPMADVESLAAEIERLDAHRPELAGLALGARQRAMANTRQEWNRLRAEWVRELFDEGV